MRSEKSKIHIFKSADKVAMELAAEFKRSLIQSVIVSHHFTIALSGGGTPMLFFQKLASPPYCDTIPWQNVHIFWSDERCVPPDHHDSNFGMTKTYLFDHISIPAENIHRVLGEKVPGKEAQRYAGEIKKWVPLNQRGFPQFDWILLGLGTDGHTASIFPGSAVLEDQTNICTVAIHPVTGQKRITLTLPVLNNAGRVSFFVTGQGKEQVVAEILGNGISADTYPADLVKPESGILEWYLDEGAANLL